MPFCSHGRDHALVGDVDRGQPGSTTLREPQPGLGEQGEQVDEVAVGVVGGQERREDVAALLAGGEGHAAAGRHLHEVRRRQLGPHDLGAGVGADRSAARLTDTGSGDAGLVEGVHTRVSSANRASSSVSTRPVVVDQGDVLAVGVDHRAEVRARRPHQLADAGAAGSSGRRLTAPAVAA